MCNIETTNYLNKNTPFIAKIFSKYLEMFEGLFELEFLSSVEERLYNEQRYLFHSVTDKKISGNIKYYELRGEEGELKEFIIGIDMIVDKKQAVAVNIHWHPHRRPDIKFHKHLHFHEILIDLRNPDREDKKTGTDNISIFRSSRLESSHEKKPIRLVAFGRKLDLKRRTDTQIESCFNDIYTAKNVSTILDYFHAYFYHHYWPTRV